MKRSISVAGEQRLRFWENHLCDWQAIGMSQAGYCRKHSLSENSFVYRKKRLVPARPAMSLVEVPRVQPYRFYLLAGRFASCLRINMG